MQLFLALLCRPKSILLADNSYTGSMFREKSQMAMSIWVCGAVRSWCGVKVVFYALELTPCFAVLIMDRVEARLITLDVRSGRR
jgi:hypothetical protein